MPFPLAVLPEQPLSAAEVARCADLCFNITLEPTAQMVCRQAYREGKAAGHPKAASSALATSDGFIAVQDAWTAASGHPGITATSAELVTALRLMDQAEDEAQAHAQKQAARIRELEHALYCISLVEQGCGGNLSFQEMAASAMGQARAAIPSYRP